MKRVRRLFFWRSLDGETYHAFERVRLKKDDRTRCWDSICNHKLTIVDTLGGPHRGRPPVELRCRQCDLRERRAREAGELLPADEKWGST